MNNQLIEFQHTVRKRTHGSKVGGKTVGAVIPDFDWDQFKHCPHAAEFAKKAYFAEARRQAREAAECSPGADLPVSANMEDFLVRALTYTKDEIRVWVASRDWTKAVIKNPEKSIQILKEELPKLATASGASELRWRWSREQRARVFEYVASVADPEIDPIADYITTTLTAQSTWDEITLDDL